MVREEPIPIRSRTSAPPGGRYPPSSWPTRCTVPPQGMRLGHTRRSLTLAGTIVVTCPLEGRIVAVPPVTARMIREGPGGSVADQPPFGPVVTTASWLKAPELLSGAARMRTDWPGSGTPAAVVYSAGQRDLVAVRHSQGLRDVYAWRAADPPHAPAVAGGVDALGRAPLHVLDGGDRLETSSALDANELVVPANRGPVPPHPDLFAHDPALQRVDDPCQADLGIRGFAQRQRQLPGGAGAIAHVVARRGLEGVGTAEPCVIEAREEMRAVKARWKGASSRWCRPGPSRSSRPRHQTRLSLVSTTSAVGSPGFCGWKLNDGGDSSILIVIESPSGVRLALRPDGPVPRDARHTVEPSPSTVSPTAGRTWR